MSSPGQQNKRRRRSNTSSSYDVTKGVDRKDLNEEDGEEDRAIKNDTDTKYRRTVAAAAAATSSNGILRPQEGGSQPNKWELTPISILIRTMSYMDNETLMVMCLVCKQIRDIIWTGQEMHNKLVRVFELSPSKDANFGDLVRRFVSNMNRYFQNSAKTRILRGFQHWKVQDVEEFDDNSYVYIDDDNLERLTQNIRMTGIIALDISLPSPIALHEFCRTLHRVIPFMVPNLQELDLSNSRMMCSGILEGFAARCPRLEIIRWNNNGDCSMDADGCNLQSMNNLKELYFDNCCFHFIYYYSINEDEDIDDNDDDDDDNGVCAVDAMSDSNNHPDIFLFHSLSDKPLERISIRNVRYTDSDDNKQIIPQSILMKFVRHAPATVVWFRSDLSPANIRILQSERPGIQYLN